jgi:hypothetical protein
MNRTLTEIISCIFSKYILLSGIHGHLDALVQLSLSMMEI